MKTTFSYCFDYFLYIEMMETVIITTNPITVLYHNTRATTRKTFHMMGRYDTLCFTDRQYGVPLHVEFFRCAVDM